MTLPHPDAAFKKLADEFIAEVIVKTEELYCFCAEDGTTRAIRWTLEIDEGQVVLRCKFCKKMAMEEIVAKLQMSATPVVLEHRGFYGDLDQEIIVTVNHG